MKPLVYTPNKILNQSAQPVSKIDKKITQLISDLKETLEAANDPKGVGLAAPQIGVSLQIFAIKPQETDPIQVFINPQITWKSKQQEEKIKDKNEHRIEGCLSVKNIWGVIKRHQQVKVKYQTEIGDIKEEKFSGFPAIIIQHEVDHLNGILFTQRVLEQKGKLYQPGKNDQGEDVLEELEI